MVKNESNPRRKRNRSLSPSPVPSGVSTRTITQFDHPHFTRQKSQKSQNIFTVTGHANQIEQIRTVSDSSDEQQHQKQKKQKLKQQENLKSPAFTISPSSCVPISCTSNSIPLETVAITATVKSSSHNKLLPPLAEKKRTSSDQQQQENICGSCNHPLHLPPPPKPQQPAVGNKKAKYGNSPAVAKVGKKQHETVALPQTTTTTTTTKEKDAFQVQKHQQQHQLDYRIITCANYSKDSKSSKCLLQRQPKHNNNNSVSALGHNSRTNLSPHFHLCCSGVPRNSSLYKKLVEALDKKEAKKHLQKKQLLAGSTSSSVSPSLLSSSGRSVSPAFPHQQNSSTMRQSSSSTVSSSSSSSSPIPFNNDPSSKAVASQFLCPACDIKGTSMYLYEYFSKIHELKVQYFNDHEAVYTVQPVGYVNDTMNEIGNNNESNESKKEGKNREDDGNNHKGGKQIGMGKENGFVSFLIDRHDQNQQGNTNSVSLQQSYKNTELRLDHIQNILSQIPSSAGTNHSLIDPTHLVGQPIRLWCDIASCYYTGRIIASRVIDLEDLHRLKDCTKKMYKNKTFATCANSNSIGNAVDVNSKQSIFLDRDIGRTQYLIRFRAGIEGRKVAVHEWVFLEEHAITVAISLVWVNMNFCARLGQKKIDKNIVEKKRENNAPSKFRPLQLFVRSALEMTAMDEINHFPHSDDNNKLPKNNSASFIPESIKSIGIFFSKKFQSIVLPLNNKNHLGAANPKMTDNHDKTTENGVISKVSTVIESCIGGFLSSTKKSFVPPAPSPGEELDRTNDGKGKGEEKKGLDGAKGKQSSEKSEGGHFFFADFNNPPELLKLHLGDGKSSDETLNISVSLATMEAEEQRRVRAQQQCGGKLKL